MDYDFSEISTEKLEYGVNSTLEQHCEGISCGEECPFYIGSTCDNGFAPFVLEEFTKELERRDPAKKEALIELDLPDEILLKLDLPDEILLKLALEAHAQDITLNKYINDIMRRYIEEAKIENIKDVEESSKEDIDKS